MCEHIVIKGGIASNLVLCTKGEVFVYEKITHFPVNKKPRKDGYLRTVEQEKGTKQ